MMTIMMSYLPTSKVYFIYSKYKNCHIR